MIEVTLFFMNDNHTFERVNVGDSIDELVNNAYQKCSSKGVDYGMLGSVQVIVPDNNVEFNVAPVVVHMNENWEKNFEHWASVVRSNDALRNILEKKEVSTVLEINGVNVSIGLHQIPALTKTLNETLKSMLSAK